MPPHYLRILVSLSAELSLEWYRKQEMVAAEKWIKESTGAQEVRRVQITTTAQSLRTSPVYVPVYIFRSLHFGAAHS